MLSSDSDDGPLLLHRSQRETPKQPAKSRSPSPLPDWLSQPCSSPVKALEILDNSDDDAEAPDEPSKNEANGNEGGRGPAAEQSKRAANGDEVARAKRGRAALETSSDSEAEEPKPALKRLKSTAKADQKLDNTAKASRTGKSQQGITAWLKKQETPAAKPEPELELKPSSAAGEGPVELPGPSQKQAGKGSQQQMGSQKPAKLAADSTTGLLAVEGEVPIMMPAKLATNKVIMELQSGSEAEAVDLSGDAGVVGRWLVQGSTASPELLMDLKGVLFSATPVPSASTLCVVNLTATEAKVEVLTSDFLQLRPAAAQGGAGDEDAQDDCFMYDDDDNYQYEGGTQAKGQDDEAGTATAGKAKKAKAGGVSKKAAKKSGAKPVRKKPGKATAGAKGRKKK